MQHRAGINKKEGINQFINCFWTIIGFAPVLIFWIGNGIDGSFYVSLGAGLLMMVLPGKALDALTLSLNRRSYERLQVRLIRRFVQNGDMAKKMASASRASIVHNPDQAKGYLKTIAMYERFHWACFVFFLSTTVLCFVHHRRILGLLTIAANIVYNVSTLLLQQYNKIRIKRILR